MSKTEQDRPKKSKLASYIVVGGFVFIYGLSAFGFYMLYRGLLGDLIYLIAISVVMIYQFFIAKRCQTLIDFINLEYLHNYFKDWTCTLLEPIPEKKALISLHPHGILNIGLIWNCYHFFQAKMLASRALLSMPFLGIFLRMWDVQPVNAESFKQLMQSEQNIGFIPGGFEEATITSQTQSRIFIKNRKGFIKYALQYGYTIFPGYTFGENKIYWVFEPFLKLRLLINKLKVPGTIFFTRFGLMPDPSIEIHTIIGKGMACPKIENPTNNDIDEYHAQYIEKVKDLYYQYREKFGEKSDLKIF